ncbi:conserved hypothetical protein [Candidatus Koribacter versatilis Ellin345]|uniref:Periplasmic heavy metal sensor n=1 Tax=Koribacter versatilis (strain Ellin345) TaxID=204669 RepID=Q1IJV3_KORVE|nr:Spy/CpxP family protein refolding chaperone [Candidatus Koribacter versatilis]ABF42847.1 conserved hypothetical protein [Candidatus Koribacter versatilis Ellin345]
MKKIWLAVAAVVLVGVVAATAQSAGMLRRHGARNFWVRHIMADLDITDQQREQIKQVLKDEKPNIQALVQRAEAERVELRTMNTFDEAKVRSVAESNSSLYVDAIVEREKVRTKIFTVLTPEQRTKVNKMIEQCHEGVQERLENLGEEL